MEFFNSYMYYFNLFIPFFCFRDTLEKSYLVFFTDRNLLSVYKNLQEEAAGYFKSYDFPVGTSLVSSHAYPC